MIILSTKKLSSLTTAVLVALLSGLTTPLAAEVYVNQIDDPTLPKGHTQVIVRRSSEETLPFPLQETVDAITNRDILLEAKGAYSLPMGQAFDGVFTDGSPLVGAELTFQLRRGSNWYGFTSVDFLIKKGHRIGLENPLRAHIIPLALGIKYFVPFDCGDFYVGLGFQPTHVKTTNIRVDGEEESISNWGMGGVAKVGSYIDLPGDFFLDPFINFSFGKVNCAARRTFTNGTSVSADLHINEATFGLGIGYRFTT